MNERIRKQYEAAIHAASNIVCMNSARKIARKFAGGKAGFVIDTISTAASIVAGTGLGNAISDMIFENEDEGVRYVKIRIIREDNES